MYNIQFSKMFSWEGVMKQKINFLSFIFSFVCIIYSNEKIKPDKTNQIDKVIKYEIPNDNIQKLTKLKGIFKLNDGSKQTRNDNLKYIRVENDNSFIKLNDDGTYEYHIKKRDEFKESNISDNDAIRLSKKLLAENDLLLSGFSFKTVGYETVTSESDPKKTKILRKFVYFNRKIDNEFTCGVSRIVVGIDQNGMISDLFCVAKNTSVEQNIKIKDFNTAYSDLKRFNGLITMDGDVNKANIKKVELLYWEDNTPNSDQTYIQPVYKFSGDTYNENGEKGEFIGYIRAIPDDITVVNKDNNDIPESTQKLSPKQ